MNLETKIKKEMQEMGYAVIPDFSNIELKDTEGWDVEIKRAYYSNLSKLGLEQAWNWILLNWEDEK